MWTRKNHVFGHFCKCNRKIWLWLASSHRLGDFNPAIQTFTGVCCKQKAIIFVQLSQREKLTFWILLILQHCRLRWWVQMSFTCLYSKYRVHISTPRKTMTSKFEWEVPNENVNHVRLIWHWWSHNWKIAWHGFWKGPH